jgi:plastocyanin
MRAAGPAVAVALVALAGCGEKRETSTGGASSGSSAPVTVSETEFKLTPASFKVPKAGPLTILVRNDGATAHALALVTPSGEVKTGTLAPGKSQTLKADLKAGKYQIYCPIDGHRGKGMKGVIVVGSGSGGSSGSGGGSSGAGGRSYGGGY